MTGIAGAIKAGDAYMQLGLKGRDKVEAGLRRLNARVKIIGQTLKKAALGFAALGAAAVIPLAVTVKAASDMEETMNKFNVVFGDSAEEVKAWSDQMGGALGRSKKQMAEFTAEAADLLMPLGLAKDDATDMSKILTVLAVDLASFNNKADADVFRDLQAALTGSSEVMKKYGVVVDMAAVKQELLNQGLDPKVATNAQKAQARLKIILEGTTAAQGDAIRSADSFANQTKRLKSQLTDLATVLGEKVLPFVTSVVKELNIWMQSAERVSQHANTLYEEFTKVGESFTFFDETSKLAIKALGLIREGVDWIIGGLIDWQEHWHQLQADIASGVGDDDALLYHLEQLLEAQIKADELREKLGIGDEGFTASVAAGLQDLRDKAKKAGDDARKDIEDLFNAARNMKIGQDGNAHPDPPPAPPVLDDIDAASRKARFTIGHVVSATGGRFLDTIGGKAASEASKQTKLQEDIREELRRQNRIRGRKMR